MKLTQSQRLDRCHVSLLRDDRTLVMSGILMMGKSEITNTPMINPTACTNGLNKYYDEKFVASLSDEELRALVLHENLHVMFKHLTVWQKLFKQNPAKANMAADYVVNGFIEKMDPGGQFIKPIHGKPPGQWLSDKKYDNMDVGEVFRLLPDPPGGSGKGVIVGGGLDGHNWEEADQLTKAEREQLSMEIDQAIRQGMIAVGKVAGKKDRTFEGLVEPKVDWRKALRDFIVTHCDGRDESTWKRPNRRWLQYDTYLPSMRGISTGDLVIAIDTSGSTYVGNLLARFMSEVNAICTAVRPKKLHMIYWDAEVAGHEEYTQDQMGSVIATTKPKGGGGTAPSVITKFLEEKRIKPLASVVLTDGYVGSDWGGTWPSPVLWVIMGDKNAQPSTGVVVHADANDD